MNATDSFDRENAVGRPLEIVALTVQAEAAILLLSPAIALVVRDAAPDPRAGLFALCVAPFLWRLGEGVANASRVAIGVLAALVALHLISINGPAIDPVDVVVVAIEVIAVCVAIVTLRKDRPPLRRGWNRRLAWQTVIPVVMAIAWSSLARGIGDTDQRGAIAAQHRAVRWLALMLTGTAVWLGATTEFPARLVRAITGAPLPSKTVSRGLKGGWTKAPRLDAVAAIVIGGISWWTLARFMDLSTGPGVMLVPGVILFPLTSLLGLATAVAWAASAWAHHTSRPWSRRPRAIAVFGTAMLAFVVVPFMLAMANAFVRGKP